MIRVSAGIVRREDGRILICQRGEGRNNAHLWEFPGGKQEAGETAEECLLRELQEELRLSVRQVQTLCQREEGGILFTFLTAETDEAPTLTEHEDFAFVKPREMLRYPFCPADTAVARCLTLQSPPLDTFLWDVDGTLMDTYPGMVSAFCKAAEQLGIRVSPDRVLTLMKDRLGHCIRVIAEENGLPVETLDRAFREEEKRIPPALIQPVKGIPETLRTLKRQGGRHYLVTHRQRDVTWQYLRNAGLDELFSGGVFPEDGLPYKPAPDMILHLLRQYDLQADRCVMIGDRPLDVQCGRNAGVIGCLIDADGRFASCETELRTDTAENLASLLCPALTVPQ